MDYPVIVLGGGGHAKVLLWTLSLLRARVLGFTDPDPGRPEVFGARRLGGDEILNLHNPLMVRLVNGLGSIGRTGPRRRLYETIRHRGYRFRSVVHPGSRLEGGLVIPDGVQVMAGVIVQPGCTIGENTVLNTRCSVDHDCEIGAHVNIAPGAVLSGGIKVGDGAHVGTGACVIQGVVIGEDSIVGAGAVVVRDVPPGVTVVGVPARILRKATPGEVSCEREEDRSYRSLR